MNSSVEIIDVSGKVIKSFDINSPTTELDITEFGTDFYKLKISG